MEYKKSRKKETIKPKKGRGMRVALSIAGSDSSGGAGVQADIKTFEAHGVFGTTAVTTLTAQNTQGVSDIHQLRPDFVEAQIAAVLQDFDVSVVKIGMLFSKEIIKAVERALSKFDKPIILDPVFISHANSLLLREDAIEALKGLFPRAALITPNMYEAYRLFGYAVGNSEALANIQELASPVLIKNHILQKADGTVSVDILYRHKEKFVFETPFSDSTSMHGTGCSFSAAIAANIALGYNLTDSIARAKKFVYFAIESAPDIGSGNGPINHKEGYRKMKLSLGEEI